MTFDDIHNRCVNSWDCVPGDCPCINFSDKYEILPLQYENPNAKIKTTIWESSYIWPVYCPECPNFMSYEDARIHIIATDCIGICMKLNVHVMANDFCSYAYKNRKK